MLYLVILAVGVIGCTIGIHLMYSGESAATKLLGAYTLVIAITSTEPIGIFVPIEIKPFLNGIIAVCSVMIGPLLFLYCKYRLAVHEWRIREYVHFTPAIVLILIHAINYYIGAPGSKSDSEEILFYLLFVIQLLSYSFAAFFIVVTKSRNSNPTMQQKIQTAFLKPLVVSSVILFSYSFLHTMFPVLKQDFVLTIQVMIGVLIVVIAFLNGEKLDKHIEVK
jgi:hypothetical protein